MEKVSTNPAPAQEYPNAIMFRHEYLGWIKLELMELNVTGRSELFYVMPGSFIGFTPRTAADLYHARVPRVRPVEEEDPDPIISQPEAVTLARSVSEQTRMSRVQRLEWASRVLARPEDCPVESFKELSRSEAGRLRSELDREAARLYSLPAAPFTRTAPRGMVAF